MIYKIHNFASLEEARGKYILTSAIQSHGYPWKLCVYPRGHEKSSKDVEYVSVYLRYVGDAKEDLAAKVSIRCNAYKQGLKGIKTFDNANKIRGWPDYLERNDILENHLDEDGTLVIDVDLQIAVEKEDVWYPAVSIPNDMLTKLYESSETTSDVVFGVDGEEFPAHKNILSLRAKTLYELTKDHENNDDVTVPIQDIEKDVFESVLEFIYCVRKPEIKDEAIATKLLLAADRLDCTELKLYVESTITDKFLKASNAAHWLLIGDSHSCALLKETAMKIYKSYASSVIESDDVSWQKIRESKRLVVELLEFCAVVKKPQPAAAAAAAAASSTNNKRKRKTKKEIDAVDHLDVTSLREQLLEANLVIDGSREILVDRLKGYYGTRNLQTPKAASSSPKRRRRQR